MATFRVKFSLCFQYSHSHSLIRSFPDSLASSRDSFASSYNFWTANKSVNKLKGKEIYLLKVISRPNRNWTITRKMVKKRFFLHYFFFVEFRFLIQLEKSRSEFYRYAENQCCAWSGERVSLAIVRCVVENVGCFLERWQMKRRVGDIRQADSRASKN